MCSVRQRGPLSPPGPACPPGTSCRSPESPRAGGGAGSQGGRLCWFVFLLSTDSMAAFVRSAASLSGCHGDAHFTDKETDLGGAGKATCSRSLAMKSQTASPGPRRCSPEASVPGPCTCPRPALGPARRGQCRTQRPLEAAAPGSPRGSQGQGRGPSARLSPPSSTQGLPGGEPCHTESKLKFLNEG